MSITALLAAFLPVGLMLMMLVVGLRLKLGAVVQAFAQPRALAWGVGVQMLALPVLAYGLAQVFALPPVMAAGLILVAAAPGGITSNYITLLARADIALSAAMTLVTTCLAILWVPLVLNVTGAAQLPGVGGMAQMTAKLTVVALVPMALGLLAARLWPQGAARVEKILSPLSRVVFAAMVLATFVRNWQPMMENLDGVAPATVALNLGAVGLALLVGRLARLAPAQVQAISIELSLQNVAVAMFVAGSLLGDLALAVPGLIYAMVMNVTALAQIAAGRVRRDAVAA